MVLTIDELSREYKRTQIKAGSWYKFERFLQRVSYKPKWAFQLIESYDYGILALVARLPVTNSYPPYDLTVLQSPYPFPHYWLDDERQYKYIVDSCIRNAEDHERREWFKIDGILVDDPHAPSSGGA